MWGTSSGTSKNPGRNISDHRFITVLVVGPIGFEEMTVSLLENWWAEMNVDSQKSQLIWGTP